MSYKRSLTYTLLEAFANNKPNISYLKVFGCVTFCYTLSIKWNKLNSKAICTLFIDYDENNCVYCYNDPITRKVIISRDVIFDERNVNPKLS